MRNRQKGFSLIELLIVIAIILVITLIGLSRVYLGVHWPSDVLAGYAAALIWMGAVRVLALNLEARRGKPGSPA